MDFWNNATNFFWGQESFSLLVLVLGIFTLLFYFRHEDRASLFNTLGFYFACLFGLFISGVLHAMEFLRAGDIMHEVFIIGAGIAVIRLLGQFVFRLILPAVKLTPPRITEDLFVIVAYVAWFMVRLRYAGLDLSSILATSAVITAVIAFAMQDTLGNILGGLALQLDNSVEVGDWIKVDDISG
jgi:small-conductance mechanosensitive channel